MMVVKNIKTGDEVHFWQWKGNPLLEQIVALQIYIFNSDPNITVPLTNET
jgi:hypothetical protein